MMHISPSVATGLRLRSRAIKVYAMVAVEGGNFLGQQALCLSCVKRLPSD